MRVDLVVNNISELITMRFSTKPPIRMNKNFECEIIKNASIALKDGKIFDFGKNKTIQKKYSSKKIINAENKVVTPGLVDPHTHLIFAGNRANEFEMRTMGISYEEIAKKGGGIMSTVRATQKTSENELFKLALERVSQMLKYGTTTVEIKSGYGLTFKDEIKILRVIKRLKNDVPIDVVGTFLGAHVVPEEFKNNRLEYIKILIEEMMPYISTHRLADFCDVFCDEGAFTLEESSIILVGGIINNLKPKIHSDEFKRLGATTFASKLGAVSCDHLCLNNDEDIEALKNSNTVAVVLPTTSLFLGGKNFAPVRKFIQRGVCVALGTDFNPGTSTCKSMQIVMQVACSLLKMTPLEALVASTINSACAILMQHKVGSLEIGKQADLLIWNTKSYQEIPYYFGENMVSHLIKKGVVLY